MRTSTSPEPPPQRPDLFEDLGRPREPLQARSRDRRAALLDAGLESFTLYGYEASSVKLIAYHGKMTVGGFYQHFASKKHLLLVLMDKLLDEIDGLNPDLDAQQAPGSQVMNFIRHAINVDLQYAGVYRAWRDAAAADPDIKRLKAEVEAWTAARVTALLEAIAALPGARPGLDLQALGQVISLLFWELLLQTTPGEAISTRRLDAAALMVYHTIFQGEA